MKVLAENKALEKVLEIKRRHRDAVTTGYEHKAKECRTCETKGACCLDVHFVNVRVSRLEALLMTEELRKLPAEDLRRVGKRIEEAIERFSLERDGENEARTYACPLFEPSVGCLVHEVKPVPCVQHACYERESDLPPETLREEAEMEIDGVARRTYGKSLPLLSIPVAIDELLKKG